MTVKYECMQALQTRAQMGGINAAKQAVRNHALSASQMQSRLDRALLHYHTFVARNKALQSEITELRYSGSPVHFPLATLSAAPHF